MSETDIMSGLYGRVAGRAQSMFKSTKRKGGGGGRKEASGAGAVDSGGGGGGSAGTASGNGSSVSVESIDTDLGKELGRFAVSYLGSVAVRHDHGNAVCASAVKSILSLDQPERQVNLVVTPKGLFLLDAGDGGSMVRRSPIGDVTFMSIDGHETEGEPQRFSYITKQVQGERNVLLCHSFTVEREFLPKIPTAVNQAFVISAGGEPESESAVVVDAAAAAAAAAPTTSTACGEGAAAVPRRGGGGAAGKRGNRASIMFADKADAVSVFSCKYLGSVPVVEARGNDVVIAAVKRIKEMGQPPRPTDIVITDKHVDIADSKTNEVLRTVPIMEISFVALDPKDKRLLTYITSDQALGTSTCHAFQISKSHEPEEIPRAISEAFKAAKQTLQEGDVARLSELGLLPQAVVVRGAGRPLGLFEAKFLGAVNAIAVSGNYVVDAALQEVKKAGGKSDGCVLVISHESVKTIEGLTGSQMSSVLVSTISFIATAGPKKNVFAFITHDVKLKKDTCHLYECSRAMEVSRTVSTAFQGARELYERRKGNPFAAITSERRALKGPLFQCQLHRSDLKAEQPIGSGQFGQVYSGTFKGIKVAVKEVRDGTLEEDQEEFKKEAETMLDMDHENLVKLIGVSMQQKPWLCVIEYMQYGDLRAVMQTCRDRGVTVTKLEMLNFASQLAGGLEYLAGLRYIHMDLAARNVLLGARNRVKLADFGLTRKLDPGSDHYVLRKTAKLPIRWMAIESITHKIFSEASDVWAFGIVMWEVASYGALPFHDVHNVNVQEAVLGGKRLQRPPGCDEGYFAACRACWLVAEKRPKFEFLNRRLREIYQQLAKEFPEERDVGALALSALQ